VEFSKKERQLIRFTELKTGSYKHIVTSNCVWYSNSLFGRSIVLYQSTSKKLVFNIFFI